MALIVNNQNNLIPNDIVKVGLVLYEDNELQWLIVILGLLINQKNPHKNNHTYKHTNTTKIYANFNIRQLLHRIIGINTTFQGQVQLKQIENQKKEEHIKTHTPKYSI